MNRWLIPEPRPVAALEALGDLPLLGRQVLAARGLDQAAAVRAFLAREDPGHDPFSLPGMPAAVDRVLQAVEGGEKVAVYGDYDADGITATAILCLGLRALGLAPVAHLPDRFAEGYGLRAEALSLLGGQGVSLVITVDCGVRSVGEVAWARSQGIDVIVTDHHLAGSELPPARAVVNPRLEGTAYPYAGLSGAGVAYKLLQAVSATCPNLRPDATLDLVAIGTIADLAPLNGENRYLVAQGLDVLRQSPRLGLAELIRVAGARGAEVNAASIAFGVAPRLNAVGRLHSPRPALDLLLAEDQIEAARLAQDLDQANRTRQGVTRREFEKAREQVLSQQSLPALLTVHSRDLGEGILGLVAARLTEEFYRPSLVARVGDETVRASLRSVAEFPITAALERISDQLIEFGGHATAAGFTAATDKLEPIGRALEAMAADVLQGELGAELRVDAVASLNQLDEVLMRFLDQFEPTGQGNPPVLFAARNLEVLSKRAVGSDGAHLKLLLRDQQRSMDAIGFRLGDRLKDLPRQVDILFNLERNNYLGVGSLQLNLKDVRPASPQTGT